MKPKRFKYIYLLLCVALCITTISRGYYLKHHTNEGNPFSRAINTIIPEAIPGINHVIDDSLSDLEETKKMERTIERFMAQWEIKRRLAGHYEKRQTTIQQRFRYCRQRQRHSGKRKQHFPDRLAL